jgi:hypothetical protein
MIGSVGFVSVVTGVVMRRCKVRRAEMVRGFCAKLNLHKKITLSEEVVRVCTAVPSDCCSCLSILFNPTLKGKLSFSISHST